MVAMEIEKLGFPAVYISGAVLSADLGLPDIGLTTLNEVANRGNQIARVTNLPCIIDADTGFGEPMNVARTVLTFEESGLAGLHLEDQMNLQILISMAIKNFSPENPMLKTKPCRKK